MNGVVWTKLLLNHEMLVERGLFRKPIELFLEEARCNLKATVMEGMFFFTDVRKPYFQVHLPDGPYRHPNMELSVYLPKLQKGMVVHAFFPQQSFANLGLTKDAIHLAADKIARTIS